VCGDETPPDAFFEQDGRGVGPLTAYGSTDPGSWIIGGRTPADTTSVTVTMTDGRTIPARVRGGYWLAWNQLHSNHAGWQPVSVTAVTPQRTFQKSVTG
jgi:hypothetical protein